MVGDDIISAVKEKKECYLRPEQSKHHCWL